MKTIKSLFAVAALAAVSSSCFAGNWAFANNGTYSYSDTITLTSGSLNNEPNPGVGTITYYAGPPANISVGALASASGSSAANGDNIAQFHFSGGIYLEWIGTGTPGSAVPDITIDSTIYFGGNYGTYLRGNNVGLTATSTYSILTPLTGTCGSPPLMNFSLPKKTAGTETDTLTGATAILNADGHYYSYVSFTGSNFATTFEAEVKWHGPYNNVVSGQALASLDAGITVTN